MSGREHKTGLSLHLCLTRDLMKFCLIKANLRLLRVLVLMCGLKAFGESKALAWFVLQGGNLNSLRLSPALRPT